MDQISRKIQVDPKPRRSSPRGPIGGTQVPIGEPRIIEGVTGAVLAGGRSRRFGSNKALTLWHGKPLAAAVLEVFKDLFRESFVVVKKKEAFNLTVPLIEDMDPDPHPLGGIVTALTRASMENVFVCACDMPFVSAALVRFLCDQRGNGAAAVIPLWAGVPQPLCGVYASSCVAPFRERILHGELSVVGALASVNTHFVHENELRRWGETGMSFQDIDTPADFERLSKSPS
ncbi:MAG: molybdenum cofactor guanylyltransferase [Elusimicrobia bacterium]|nr:molybdenum cofactor guanylyltransferase [Elusimicrobiota bacterium]MBP9698468.1 molybdenum cofactor guanylyltransferase [Elusimicrobiota bacterium]